MRRSRKASTRSSTSPPSRTSTARSPTPAPFLRTNVVGTGVLLDARAGAAWGASSRCRPTRCTAASVRRARHRGDPASAEQPVRGEQGGGRSARARVRATHGLDVVVTRCSNNYGPYQFPEKLIPLFVTNALADEPLPLYGDGGNVRDWIHVEDHCEALDRCCGEGRAGQVYNVGGGNERRTARSPGDSAAARQARDLVRHVADRPAHDRRYALDSTKLRREPAGRRGARSPAGSTRPSPGTEQRAWWGPGQERRVSRFYERRYGERLN